MRNATKVQVAADLETAVEVQKPQEGAEFPKVAVFAEFTKVAVKRRASIARMRETAVCQIHKARQPCVPSEPVLRDDRTGQRRENVYQQAKL